MEPLLAYHRVTVPSKHNHCQQFLSSILQLHQCTSELSEYGPSLLACSCAAGFSLKALKPRLMQYQHTKIDIL